MMPKNGSNAMQVCGFWTLDRFISNDSYYYIIVDTELMKIKIGLLHIHNFLLSERYIIK